MVGDTLTLTGSNFAPGYAVLVDDVPGDNIVYTDAEHIDVDIPAGVSGLVAVSVAGVTLVGAVTVFNEPAGLTRFCETDFTAKPAASGMIDGAGSASADLSIEDDGSAPSSPTKVLKQVHQIGKTPGSSGKIFAMWDLASYRANTEYSEFYDRTYINVYGNGASYEVPGHGDPGIKMLGYWGVAFNNRIMDFAPAHIFPFLGSMADTLTDNGYPVVPDTSTDFRVNVYTQAIGTGSQRTMAQNRNTDTRFQVGVWTVIETYMKLNTFNVADGEIRIWLNGILVFEHTDVLMISDYTVTAATTVGGTEECSGPNAGKSGFFHRYWDPVWGGGASGPAKSRDDYFLVDHTYMSGVWLRDKA